MPTLVRVLRALPLLLISPVLMTVSVLAIAFTDLLFAVFGRKRADSGGPVSRRSASVVIPNWNGCDLLQKYLPSIETALADNPGNEIIVVDNGSSDGSAAFLAQRFPRV